MLTDRELSDAVGGPAYGSDGEAIGTVRHFLADDRSGRPTWASVNTDEAGTRSVVVPVVEARFTDGGLRLPVTRALTERAPAIATDEHLDPAEEVLLRRFYGLTPGEDADTGEDTGTAGGPGMGRGGLTGDGMTDATVTGGAVTEGAVTDGAMTRSEEQLRVRTEQVAATRVRLVKYVVTEEVQVTVPIRREEVRIEEVPLDAPDPGPGESLTSDGRHVAEDDAAVGDAATAEGLPAEIVLHREEPVVSVRVVPAERVRLRTEVVQGQEQVGGRLQREQIVLDQDGTE